MVLGATRACRGAGTSDEARELRAYAAGIQTGIVAFVVGGALVNLHYSEILWHFFGVSVAISARARELAGQAHRDSSVDVAGVTGTSRMLPAGSLGGR
jgi:hypothetical protein